MRRTSAKGHDGAAAGARPGAAPEPAAARPAGADAGWDPAAVDADVPAAVGRVLDTLLAERLDACAALDPVFTRDVAERVARFTLDGGKRTRSRFLWWGLRACGGGAEAAQGGAALHVAAGLELLQSCALVHDDVMDRSSLRRGRPAVHAALAAQYASSARGSGRPGRFGTAAAVLAGDLALAWADDTVAAADRGRGPDARVGRIWRALRTEMVAGQYLDLHGQTTAAHSAERALRAACLKSARYSVELPLALGAALADADAGTAAALGAVGRRAGLAFQLRDDLLGVFGDPLRTGKPSGADIAEGKPTYLVAVARERAAAAGDRGALDVLDARLGAGELSAAGLDEVRRVLVGTGARAAVEAEVARLAASALRRLDAAPLQAAARRRLRELVRAAAGVSGGPPRRPEPAAAVPAGEASGGKR